MIAKDFSPLNLNSHPVVGNSVRDTMLAVHACAQVKPWKFIATSACIHLSICIAS